jgi:peptidoglycan/xylan/chitin deacetylase (PgdA/CDA1 family)
VASTVIRGLSGGGTVLLHDSDVAASPCSWRATVDALPWVLDHCRAHGFAVGPLIDHGERAGNRLPTTDRIIG